MGHRLNFQGFWGIRQNRLQLDARSSLLKCFRKFHVLHIIVETSGLRLTLYHLKEMDGFHSTESFALLARPGAQERTLLAKKYHSWRGHRGPDSLEGLSFRRDCVHTRALQHILQGLVLSGKLRFKRQ